MTTPTVLGEIRAYFRRRRLKTTKADVRAAAKKALRLHGDLVYQTEMTKYYDSEAAALDPNESWWDFADSKQCALDSENESTILVRKHSRAEADHAAKLMRMESLT